MKALKVDYRNYPTYRNLAIQLGQTPHEMQFMSQKFVVVRDDPATKSKWLEIYDETDFRTFFKWTTTGSQDRFMDIEALKPDEDGEYVKWEPGHDLDLGAV